MSLTGPDSGCFSTFGPTKVYVKNPGIPSLASLWGTPSNAILCRCSMIRVGGKAKPRLECGESAHTSFRGAVAPMGLRILEDNDTSDLTTWDLGPVPIYLKYWVGFLWLHSDISAYLRSLVVYMDNTFSFTHSAKTCWFPDTYKFVKDHKHILGYLWLMQRLPGCLWMQVYIRMQDIFSCSQIINCEARPNGRAYVILTISS